MTYIVDAGCKTPIQSVSFLSRLNTAIAKRKQRNALCGLSSDALNDIGLSRAEVNKECAKTFFSDLIS